MSYEYNLHLEYEKGNDTPCITTPSNQFDVIRNKTNVWSTLSHWPTAHISHITEPDNIIDISFDNDQPLVHWVAHSVGRY